MATFRDLPTVPRLAAVATVVYGLAMLIFAGLVFWVAATTGEPVILNPHHFGEAYFEAIVFAIIMGVACYGMATLDWLLRQRTDDGGEGRINPRYARRPVHIRDGDPNEAFESNDRQVDPRFGGTEDIIVHRLLREERDDRER